MEEEEGEEDVENDDLDIDDLSNFAEMEEQPKPKKQKKEQMQIGEPKQRKAQKQATIEKTAKFETGKRSTGLPAKQDKKGEKVKATKKIKLAKKPTAKPAKVEKSAKRVETEAITQKARNAKQQLPVVQRVPKKRVSFSNTNEVRVFQNEEQAPTKTTKQQKRKLFLGRLKKWGFKARILAPKTIAQRKLVLVFSRLTVFLPKYKILLDQNTPCYKLSTSSKLLLLRNSFLLLL